MKGRDCFAELGYVSLQRSAKLCYSGFRTGRLTWSVSSSLWFEPKFKHQPDSAGKVRKWLVSCKNLHSSGSTVLQIKKAVLCALQQQDNLFITAVKWISARSISHRRRLWPLHHLQTASCCWPCGMGPLERDVFGHRCLVFRQSLPLCRGGLVSAKVTGVQGP